MFLDKYVLCVFVGVFVDIGSQVGIGSSKDGSEDGEAECSDGETDCAVQDKIAELNMMKAKLAQLKGIVSAVQNIGSSDGTIQVGVDRAYNVILNCWSAVLSSNSEACLVYSC
jgi:hypothetical protein